MISAARIRLSPAALVQGVPNMWDFFVRMFPPDLSFFGLLIEPAIETVQIAAWGTLLAVLASAPLALLAAHNTSPHFVFYFITRIFLNLLRSINELIYALILVSAVGLGPFPGVLAVAGVGGSTAPPGRPAKAPPCCRASSSAAAAGCG
jgi:phosphonate transport system permease protein